MTDECEHEFEYVGSQKAETGANRYFKCKKCGCVVVRDEEGNKFLIPLGQEE